MIAAFLAAHSSMTFDPDSPSSADIELDPFAIISIEPGRGLVTTHAGTMTFADAGQRLVDQLQAYDWMQFLADRDRLQRDAPAERFIGMSVIGALASLMAEIDLHQARVLWNAHVPPAVGTLQMLALDSESNELRYQTHLATLRALTDDARIDYLLEYSDAMRAWGDERVNLVARLRHC